ncbi:MAG: DNA cytosine methyltransferase [Candidatus Tectomicrobia bacterium]|nr:DNA cytosine methyltransferase [Candidatus Tectomicrobia bacterium]
MFSGMGGFATGLVQAGFSLRWASDNDKSACEVFRHRFPGVTVVEKDVCELSVAEDGLVAVDVLAAGFPCQSFSQAGGRLGFDDPRGALFFEIPRLLGEFEPDCRPALVVLENVPHLLYGAEGDWFDQVRRALRRAGYWFRDTSCWTVNVKNATRLPQDRERLFMVAASKARFNRNPFSPPNEASKSLPPRPLSDFVDRSQQGDEDAYLSLDNRYYKMINAAMSEGDSDKNIYQLRRSYVREKKNGLCPTLTANMGIGGHNVPFIKDIKGIRRLSVKEIAKLQGFDCVESLFPNIHSTEQYRLLGNAVCVGLARLIAHQCADILDHKEIANEC